VNFNIDSLLEAYPTAKYQKRLLRTVERASAGRRPEKINVYHIHGFLRFDQKIDSEHESSDKIVLGEDEYYELFNNPSGIFNYTFLYLLREYSFLFIGLSMQDINLRRHLYLSRKEIVDSYKEEKISTLKLENKIKSRVNKHFAILKKTGHLISDDYHEQTLANLGVHVIWVDDYEEIKDILEEVYSFKKDNEDETEYKWNDVF
jgi:hypothetical protein